MKNILKKLGVLGLIITMVIPFIEVPVVNAASSCEKHIVQYFFLDAVNPDELGNYITYDGIDGGSTNAAAIPFTIPVSDSIRTTTITNVYTDDFKEYLGTEDAKDNFDYFYQELKYLNGYSTSAPSGNAKKFGAWTSTQDSTITIDKVAHGYWKNLSGETSITTSTSSTAWEDLPTSYDSFYNRSFQKIYGNYSNFDEDVTVTFKPMKATYSESSETIGFATASNASDIESLLQNAVNGDTTNLTTVDDVVYFGVRITRKVDVDVLNSKTYGTADGTEVYTNKTSYTSKSEINDSFTAYNSTAKSKITANSASDIDIENDFGYIYFPVVLNVEYKVCSVDSSTLGNWKIEYYAGAEDSTIKNIPESSDSVKTNVDLTISDSTPTRDNYTFKKWCTQENGEGTCFSSDETVSYKEDYGSVLKLYASWGNTSEGTQQKTGIISYVIGFISVGILSVGTYIIGKKKNLFKQI